MINRINAALQFMVVHHIGSPHEGDDIVFSNRAMEFDELEESSDLFLKYFLDGYKEPKFYNFTYTSGELELNPVYNFVANIFDDPSCLHEESVKISRWLHEKSEHPSIKPGDLFIAYISDILVEDELIDGIMICKAEGNDQMFKVKMEDGLPHISFMDGNSISKVDKACLVLNSGRESGFKVCNIDNRNRQQEAQYWANDFLFLEERSDDFHATSDYIKMTASYLKKQVKKDTLDKTEEVATMKVSESFFAGSESFDLQEYSQKVFQTEEKADDFRQYVRQTKEAQNKPLQESFSVSEYAVKKHSKVFRSVIKLDKNFHIYVHGDHSKIKKDEDLDGKKYYMLYYDQET